MIIMLILAGLFALAAMAALHEKKHIVAAMMGTTAFIIVASVTIAVA